MDIDYNHKHARSIWMLPSCLMMALFIADIDGLMWFIGLLGVLLIVGVCYQIIVVQPGSAGAGKRYLISLIVQVIGWGILIAWRAGGGRL